MATADRRFSRSRSTHGDATKTIKRETGYDSTKVLYATKTIKRETAFSRWKKKSEGRIFFLEAFKLHKLRDTSALDSKKSRMISFSITPGVTTHSRFEKKSMQRDREKVTIFTNIIG
jgi:hypothetical protein